MKRRISVRLSRACYRQVIRLYPSRYRRRFGADMVQMFTDEAEVSRGRGVHWLVRLWLRTVLDLLVNVPLTYIDRESWSDDDARGSSWRFGMDALRRDIRLALRNLYKNPAFAMVAVVTLGLGIGATSAIYSVVDGVLLRPLPYYQPDRLMTVWSSYAQNPKFPVSAAEFLDYQAESRAFGSMGAWGTATVTLTGGGAAERRVAGYATHTLPQTLGVEPIIGRWFTAEEDFPGGAQVVVLTYDFWQTRFGGDTRVIDGETLTVDGTSYPITGVMPPGFALPTNSGDFYLPLQWDRSQITNRSSHNFYTVARLAPGATLQGARAELRSLLTDWETRFEGVHPNDPEVHPLLLESLPQYVLGGVRPMLLALLGAVGLLLLLAAANVANLLLARGETRVREIGVRTALGARRWVLVRQLLTESMVLAAVGGAAGLLLAAGGVSLFKSLDPGGIPRLSEVALDWQVVGFTAAVSLATGLLFGALPAWRAGRRDPRQALVEGGRGGSAGREAHRTLNSLVMVQVAFAVVLVIGSGVLVKSFVRLLSVDPGFATEQRIGFSLELMPSSYPGKAEALGFLDQVQREVAALPGVEQVALARGLPMRNWLGTEGFSIEGKQLAPDEQPPSIEFQFTGPQYFQTMGIPVLEGREFQLADGPETELVALVNEESAASYFDGESPVGKYIDLFFAPRDWPLVRIVGVVGNVRQRTLGREPRPQLYLPATQLAGWAVQLLRSPGIVVRTSRTLESLAPEVRAIVNRLDPNVPVEDFDTLSGTVSSTVATERFLTVLLGTFAVVAMILSAVGVYGVIAFSVARRTKEFGIRLALGAEPAAVVSTVLKGVAGVAVAGCAVGVMVALAATRLLDSLVYQVSVRDTAVYAASVTVLVAVALMASLVPAWRAAATNPVESLRAE